MAEQTKASAVIVVRSKKAIALPPCQVGFMDFLQAKAFGDNEPKFNLDAHYDQAGIEVLSKLLDVKGGELLPELRKQQKEQNAIKEGHWKDKPLVTVEDFLEGKLKDPKPAGKIQKPFIRLQSPATRKGRDQTTVPIVMGCWPATGSEALDFAKLRMAQGSWVSPVVYLNLFCSRAPMGVPAHVPAFQLKLVGMRVLSLVQYGGGSMQAPDDADDAAIKAVMGSSFDPTDLSAFTLGSHEAPPVEDEQDGGEVDLRKSVF